MFPEIPVPDEIGGNKIELSRPERLVQVVVANMLCHVGPVVSAGFLIGIIRGEIFPRFQVEFGEFLVILALGGDMADIIRRNFENTVPRYIVFGRAVE